MTRAKAGLHVVYSGYPFAGAMLDQFKELGAELYKDEQEFPAPEEMILPLSHKDIWLDYSGAENPSERHVLAGQELGIEAQAGRLFFVDTASGERVAAVSESFLQRLRRHEENGYVPWKAYVNYVAYWTKVNGENPGVERKIVLPRVVLKRRFS